MYKESMKHLLPDSIKKYMKHIRDYPIEWDIEKREKTLSIQENLYTYESMKKNSLNYLKELQISNCEYKFSKSVEIPTLYASVYAFMIKAWFGMQVSESGYKEEWLKYFNSFQRDDGIFYDANGDNPFFAKGDGWGGRHLAGHIIIAYAKLGACPDKEFRFLEFLKSPDSMIKFLNTLDFRNMENGNKIMNYGILLQYSRDFLGMNQYNDSIIALEEWLVKHINLQTGMWNNHEMVSSQAWTNFSYHLWPLLNYDNIEIPCAHNAIDIILDNQNKFGGFSDNLISSACSDIDAIEPLIRLSDLNNHYRDNDIKIAISRAYRWVMLNKTDNGFMFEYGKPFAYGGHKNLSSEKRESNLFATWFRLLSIIYMNQYLCIDTCKLVKIPGYEMPIK